MTHQNYFKEYHLSLAQYAEILVAKAFHGNKSAVGYHGFDVANARINGRRCQIEVKSKWNVAEATVIHCSESKQLMTHLAVVFVGEDYTLEEAWLITKKQAFTMRREKTKSKYINVKDLRKFEDKMDILAKLNLVANAKI
jgi:hypothetical protein